MGALAIFDALSAAMTDPLTLLPVLAGVSAAVVVGALGWPAIWEGRERDRLRHVTTEVGRMRRRQRKDDRTRDDAVTALRRETAKPIYQKVVAALRLYQRIDDGDAALRLKQAGLHGRAAIVTFWASRALGAIGLGAFGIFYGFVVLEASVPLIGSALIAVAGIALGYWAPSLYIANRIDRRRAALRTGWPDAMDLLLLCVEGGMSLEAAFRKVAEEVVADCPPLGEELTLLVAELTYLGDRSRAYDGLAVRTGLPEIRGVVTALAQSEKYGTPVGRAIRVLSREARDNRLAAAERKAAALPPKLTVPMIVFFLPVLFAAIMTPAIIRMLNV